MANPTVLPSSRTLTVSAALRSATQSEHQRAESRPFITDLLEGRLDLGDYVRYLAQFARVYEALENGLAERKGPALLKDEALSRSSSIAADLVAFGAEDWREAIPALPSTLAYVSCIESLADDEGPRLIAHHYTRYLGDLSGGQVIATMLRRHYGATDEQLGFYRFERVENPVQYKREYRAALDSLELSDAQLAELIEEAQLAFRLNSAVFEQLAIV